MKPGKLMRVVRDIEGLTGSLVTIVRTRAVQPGLDDCDAIVHDGTEDPAVLAFSSAWDLEPVEEESAERTCPVCGEHSILGISGSVFVFRHTDRSTGFGHYVEAGGAPRLGEQ